MKFLRVPALLATLLLTSLSHANPSAFLDEVGGVYKFNFKNRLTSGETYQSENILEVVPVDDNSAYIRLKLQFANGHAGDISGIAVVQDHSLSYHNRSENCLVTLVWDKNKVVSHADYQKYPGCANFHGARGTLDNMRFPVKNQRKIRYMKIIKNSEQFKHAMQEYHANEAR